MTMGSIIGVDEAGRGPVMGPLVVAGFRLETEEEEKILENLKVCDSKKCTRRRRERLAIEIRRIGKYSIKTFSALEIDETRKVKTLNKIEGELFAEVINQLDPEDDTTVIVDSADANENSFKKYITEKLRKQPKIISIHKADEKYLVVAAASILAKTERDYLIDNIAKELKSEIGSGYPADPITRNFLEKWINDKGDLPPYTRRSWNTAKKLIDNFKKPIKTLDQYND
jgi:ribonuclease HII